MAEPLRNSAAPLRPTPQEVADVRRGMERQGVLIRQLQGRVAVLGTAPLGIAVTWASSEPPPPGWVHADGGAIDASTHPEAHALIGPNTPDLTGVMHNPIIRVG